MNLKRIYVATLLGLSSIAVNADTLKQVYETAKYKDPVILKSKAEYDVFSEQINEAKASLLPQIGFGLDASKLESTDIGKTQILLKNRLLNTQLFTVMQHKHYYTEPL